MRTKIGTERAEAGSRDKTGSLSKMPGLAAMKLKKASKPKINMHALVVTKTANHL